MTSHPALLAAGLTLAAGTYAIRLAGPLLRSRVAVPPRVERLLETAAVVLLAALVATLSLFTDHAPAGFARPLGVLVGGLLAWRRAPFLLVILAAAGTAAVLRLLGIS
ncbi:AzlD domain-containing protein [Kitasatospora kifunensis]|uniref:Branched-subunit amino acid transport protein n=1 Tax=Kitasatospora kifunensis TaxID=58351 RepID=A0A7W7VUU2_KITKI|nr:AzlD domain-containing protein [Kitasatospora kifunensis]MBB4922994.1 branched-subunit amino acid transport protein [Kitasatospora kifunensis]